MNPKQKPDDKKPDPLRDDPNYDPAGNYDEAEVTDFPSNLSYYDYERRRGYSEPDTPPDVPAKDAIPVGEKSAKKD